jgi:hypothetical protein
LLQHMQFALTREDFVNEKPAPDGYLAALDRLGATADEAVVVEDSAQEFGAARAAGIRCIIVRHDSSAMRTTSTVQQSCWTRSISYPVLWRSWIDDEWRVSADPSRCLADCRRRCDRADRRAADPDCRDRASQDGSSTPATHTEDTNSSAARSTAVPGSTDSTGRGPSSPNDRRSYCAHGPAMRRTRLGRHRRHSRLQ